MKRFIITVSGLLLLLAVFLYAVYYRGLYLDTDPDAPISAAFRTQGRDIQRLVNGSWESFEIRGVDLTSAVPCEFTSDYAGDAEDYLSWLESISDLGANCIRVFTIMDSDFYEAFYTFNTESGKALYLLQGLQVPDAANYGAEDAYGSGFRELLIQNGQSAVDVIHGKKILESNDKVYFGDIGLRNIIAGGERDSDIEKIIENAVYLHLVNLGYKVSVGQLRVGEVDFICTRTNDRRYVQVAYIINNEETVVREFGRLQNINDNYPKYVISMTPLVRRSDYEGIIHIGLREFLKNGFGR